MGVIVAACVRAHAHAHRRPPAAHGLRRRRRHCHSHHYRQQKELEKELQQGLAAAIVEKQYPSAAQVFPSSTASAAAAGSDLIVQQAAVAEVADSAGCNTQQLEQLPHSSVTDRTSKKARPCASPPPQQQAEDRVLLEQYSASDAASARELLSVRLNSCGSFLSTR